jgi:ribosomal protein S18 acetylase RimI-like enzyme
MEIRKVKSSDHEVIHELLANHIDVEENESRPPTFSHIQNLADDKRCYLFAAIHIDKVVGYALAYRFPSLYALGDMAYLYDIDVIPEFRCRGIGRQLTENLITALKSDDVRELWVGTGVENKGGQALFSSTGAVKTAETFNDYTYYLS